MPEPMLYRSEAFAEDLTETSMRPMRRPRRARLRELLAPLLMALAGAALLLL